MSGSQYARLVPKLHRRRMLPKIDRPWRPRMIAWAGPSAFYPNRFYEQDKWYKARIDKPEKLPQLHIIDPNNHLHSINDQIRSVAKEEVNIGFAERPQQVFIEKTAQERAVLERMSRKMNLSIDVESTGNKCRTVYHHYNIYEDLFGKGTYFDMVQDLDVAFDDHVVYTGNLLAPADMQQAPEVTIESVGKGFTTLLMVNLDGNATEKDGQMVHWLVANIPDGQEVSNGNEVVPYLQPLPFSGSGYHRIAFVLFRHNEPMNQRPSTNGDSLSSRVLDVAGFYKSNERQLTPSTISFCQTAYDDSVRRSLHSMGEKSPLFEYEWNEPLKPQQKEFPEKPQPFDLYLDMYRDQQEVQEELLEERLTKVQLDDYQPPECLDVNYNENKKTLPSWQHKRILQRHGRYSAIYDNSIKAPL